MFDGEDELDLDKFTMIAPDPPGHGKSRPPLKKYDESYLETEADLMAKFMQVRLNCLLIVLIHQVNYRIIKRVFAGRA